MFLVFHAPKAIRLKALINSEELLVIRDVFPITPLFFLHVNITSFRWLSDGYAKYAKTYYLEHVTVRN